MRHLRHCHLLALSLISLGAQAGSEFELVNQQRRQAGLPGLAAERTLAEAATLHARYLDRNRQPADSGQGLSAHIQQAGDAEFSGVTAAERALGAGYPHREVLENVSMGYQDAQAALDGLMSAIYHRLTFLDLEADQLGVAVGERSRVFLLGRSDIGGLCQAPPVEALYRTPVDCLGRPMTRDYYDALCRELPPAALFKPSHPVSCGNGVRLDAGFMAGVCEKPPRAARFSGHGRYYAPCDNGTRLDAAWFDAVCEGRPARALYRDSGQYYEICAAPVRVRAEWFEALCAALPGEALYADSWRYRRPCADQTEVRVEYLDGLDFAAREPRPEAVLWPPAGAVDIPPAFFIEQPDPLPDRQVSGYPVSIQFNPAKVDQVTLRDFRLFKVERGVGSPVEPVRVLDQASDPNQLLSAHEFVLFPLERLDWGAQYRFEIDALVDGRSRRFSGAFTTRGADITVLTAAERSQQFVVQSGRDYLLYLPPDGDAVHTALSSRVEHRRGNQVKVDGVDANTLRLRVDARHCDRIRMRFDVGRLVELIPAGCPG